MVRLVGAQPRYLPCTYTHTLQHAATRCNTLQHCVGTTTFEHPLHAAKHCKTLQDTATYCNSFALVLVSVATQVLDCYASLLCLFVMPLCYASLLCLFVMPLVQATHYVIHSVLQRVAVRCSALQCVAMCCSVLQRVAACCSVLQRVAACCSVATEVLDSVSSGDIGWVLCLSTLQLTATHCNKTVSVFCSTSFCVVPVDSPMQRSAQYVAARRCNTLSHCNTAHYNIATQRSICRGATLQRIVTLQHCTLQHCNIATQRSICRGTTLQRLCRTATSCRTATLHTATLAHSSEHVAARHWNNSLSHCNTAHCNTAHCNTAHCNTAHCNTAHCNIAHRHTGLSM